MDNKPRNKPDQGSSWNDESEKQKPTNPNRRQEEDSNVESQHSGQRAKNTDEGSSESPTSDRDEQLHRDRNRQTDASGRQPEE